MHAVKNNFSVKLLNSIDNIETSLIITESILLDPPFWLTFVDSNEIIEVTNVVDDMLTVIRGVLGSTATVHNANATIELRVMSEHIEETRDEIDNCVKKNDNLYDLKLYYNQTLVESGWRSIVADTITTNDAQGYIESSGNWVNIVKFKTTVSAYTEQESVVVKATVSELGAVEVEFRARMIYKGSEYISTNIVKVDEITTVNGEFVINLDQPLDLTTDVLEVYFDARVSSGSLTAIGIVRWGVGRESYFTLRARPSFVFKDVTGDIRPIIAGKNLDMLTGNLTANAITGTTISSPSITGTNLTAGTVLEADANKKIVSATKATAYNKAFEAATGNIKMDGTVSVGSLETIARADHVHPTDTSRVPTTRTVNSKALSSDITLTHTDVGAVPITRTVNSKDLSSDITLTSADVGAVPTTRTVNSKALSSDITLTSTDVGAVPTSRTVNSKALSSDITLAHADLSNVEDAGELVAKGHVSNTTQSIYGAKTFEDGATVEGTLAVNGDIVQSGESYETHVEHVFTKNDLIITRDGAFSGLGTGVYTGIQATKYDGTNNGQLVFDKDGVARVGDVGDTQAIATRQEAPTNNGVAYWNNTLKRFDTSTTLPLDTRANTYGAEDGSTRVATTAYVDFKYRFYVGDTRNDATNPNSDDKKIRFEFKTRTAAGNPGSSGTFAGVITMFPWSDNSGGNAYQLAFTSDGQVSFRTNGLDSASWTDPWRVIAFTDLSLTNQGIAVYNSTTRTYGTNANLKFTGSALQVTGEVAVTGDITATNKIKSTAGRIEDKTGYVTPVGAMLEYGGMVAPAGFLLCDYSSVSRTTYADLYSVIKLNFSKTKFTFNVTTDEFFATPIGTAHGYTTGTAVTVSSIATLPTPLVEDTTYYVRSISTTNFKLYPTLTDANNNTNAINISGGSGNYINFFEPGNFPLPDFRMNVGIGSSTSMELGNYGGSSTHALATNELPSHTHNITTAKWYAADSETGSTGIYGTTSFQTGLVTRSTGSAGSGQAHNNMQPYVVVNKIIKY